jgi:hypothetical protein
MNGQWRLVFALGFGFSLEFIFVLGDDGDLFVQVFFFVHKVGERYLGKFMDDFLDVVFVGLGVAFGETKYHSVHDLENGFLVEASQDDVLHEVITSDNV